jgi:RNA polymerase sigma-70 factor (ECF subfamily)
MGVEGIGDYAENLIRFKARKLARTAASPEVDWEDFAQDMRLDLWRRLSKFDPSKAPLNAFITRVVEHKVASIIEARTAPCRDFRRCRSSLNRPLEDQDGGRPAECGDTLGEDTRHLRTGIPGHSVEESVDLGLDTKATLARLPPELRDLCRRLMRQDLTEVARETGTPRGTLHESVLKNRRKFEKARLREYL